MPVEKLKSFLDENGVRYVTIRHSPAYTAHEIAEAADISGSELAKTVIVEIEGELAMVVLPASEQVDASAVSRAAGGGNVILACEEDFASSFPDCELGAMPPFGNLYGMKIFLSPKLAEDEEIAFNAGTHTQLVQLKFADFERLARPAITMLAST